MSTHGFPASAKTFTAIATPARSRIYLIADDTQNGEAKLAQVATITGPAAVAEELVDELNRAAWTGDRVRLVQILAAQPPPVVQACEQALESCPEPASLALGSDGKPMTLLRESFFSDDVTELVMQANAAVDLGLQFVIENSIDEDGGLDFTAKLLSGDQQVAPQDMSGWWAPPQSHPLLERFHPHPQDLIAAFSDSRWETHVGRAYWMWIEDDNRGGVSSATATWVVEFFDLRLSPDTNFRVFLEEDGLDEESRGYLTVRNRFLLWLSLWNIAVDLDGMLSMEIDSMVRDDLPRSVGEQPRAWWEAMRESADRLCDAARRGAVSDLEPRTVAEEALIALATRSDYVEWAIDGLDMDDRRQVFDSLPHSPEDGEWGEILPDLTGDTDIEMLWQHSLDGIANPDDPTNKYLGMGDYRPESWHELFDRARGHEG